jgi:hypothetical protein
MLSVQKQNVDAEAHPKRVNSVGWPDEEPVSGGKGTAAHEAHEAGQRCIGNANPVSKHGVPDRVGYTQVLRGRRTHSARYLNLALASLDKNEKHHDE